MGCRFDSSLIEHCDNENHHFTNDFQRVHEPGLVRTFEIQRPTVVDRDLASWLIAFFEYAFQVPANRIGSNEWTVPQLKILQECITLIVFTVIAFALFRSPVKWNYLVSYAFIIGAVYFAFRF